MYAAECTYKRMATHSCQTESRFTAFRSPYKSTFLHTP